MEEAVKVFCKKCKVETERYKSYKKGGTIGACKPCAARIAYKKYLKDNEDKGVRSRVKVYCRKCKEPTQRARITKGRNNGQCEACIARYKELPSTEKKVAEAQAKQKLLRQTPEYKAKQTEYRKTDEYKEKQAKYRAKAKIKRDKIKADKIAKAARGAAYRAKVKAKLAEDEQNSLN